MYIHVSRVGIGGPAPPPQRALHLGLGNFVETIANAIIILHDFGLAINIALCINFYHNISHP